jgi:hypothetical protein
VDGGDTGLGEDLDEGAAVQGLSRDAKKVARWGMGRGLAQHGRGLQKGRSPTRHGKPCGGSAVGACGGGVLEMAAWWRMGCGRDRPRMGTRGRMRALCPEGLCW